MNRDEIEISVPEVPLAAGAEDRWACEPKCGTVWNTFWTRGHLPGCRKVWTVTQCLACKQFSPHRQWYHPPSRERTVRRKKRSTDTVT